MVCDVWEHAYYLGLLQCQSPVCYTS
ncbi:hypothetical protein [Turicimonas muris]